MVRPPNEGIQELVFKSVLVRQADRTHLFAVHGQISTQPDHLGNSRRWVYDLSHTVFDGKTWSTRDGYGPAHFAELEAHTDSDGTIHLFTLGYNQEPAADAHGTPAGQSNILWTQLHDGELTPWRTVLPAPARMLHGFDVAESDGSMWLAWASWPGNQHTERIRLRQLGETLGPVEVLPEAAGRNLTYPKLFREDGDWVVYASAQTPDYQTLQVARVPREGTPRLDERLAIDFLRDEPVHGAPEALIWRETRDGHQLLHTGEHELPLSAWADSLGGARWAVDNDNVVLAYDGGVYLLRHDKKGWKAAMLQPPELETSGPFPRKFSGGVTLSVEGETALVSWWHPDRGHVVWEGPLKAADAPRPDLTWKASAGRGLGSGARAELGHLLMQRAASVEGHAPERAQCLRDIVAVGLRSLGGPGHRAGGAPSEVPAACFGPSPVTEPPATPTPAPKPPRR